ncbi:MAG TPA: tyrosine-protein phosphatase [Gemmataceae bacterium]|jgi:predicted protein tyrosine phosphatase|nr:tyrosine-protein phosphatase [Gemmataceae bacterium]
MFARSQTSEIDQPPRWSLARTVAAGLVLGSLLACAVEIGRMAVDRNKHVVVPGRVYRTAQLNPAQLEAFVHKHDIRTVVNLRGRPFLDWYTAEAQATQALGISQEDITTSANHLPSPGEIRRLIEVFDRAEHPIVIHCQQGADRTGLASAMYQLLYTDATYAEARRQCSPRYGHLAIHTAAAMDEFFDLYERWLQARGEAHSPAIFRKWATEGYCPANNRARLELLGPIGPTETGTPIVFRVRAHNTSPEPWHLKAGSDAGIFAQYIVQDLNGGLVIKDRAGYFDRVVDPGKYVDLELPVPAIASAGRYRLYVDLAQRNVVFTQYGSEALIHDWDTRDPAQQPRR